MTAEWSAGLLACLIATGGTAAGAMPGLWLRRLSYRLEVAALALAAGLMLAAATLGLMPAALELENANSDSRLHHLGIVIAFVAGVGLIAALNHLLPHEHFVKGAEGGLGRHPGGAWSHGRIWLLVIAIALHNVPEGLAVGAGFGVPGNLTAWPVAAGITLQNVPEGLVVATSLRVLGYSPSFATLTAAGTGLLEFAGGVAALAAGALFTAAVPWLLAAAAGAMVYVVGGEIIPESHRRGEEEIATFGLVVGFVLFMLLDLLLG